MAIKIRSTPSFGWEVKPEVRCRWILRRVKDPLRYFRYSANRQYFSVIISVFINCTVALQALALLLRVRKVTVSYLGTGTVYPD
jgi:hypothetical protein